MSEPKKLANKFVFWYHINEISADQEYESQIKKLAEFETLEDFWAIFQYLKKPDDCKQAIEFQLFKNPIKPMWEDENNKDGGRIALKLRKEYSNLVWEELVFAFIGDYFAKEIKDEINGLVINCKKDFNTLQIWIKSFNNEVTSALERNIREILNITSEVALDIKPFNAPQKEYNNHYNNYNNYNYKGYNQKKKQNNNYYKKKESKDTKDKNNNFNNYESKSSNEKENKEEDKKVTKTEEGNTKKEEEKKLAKEKEKEKHTEDEKEKPKEENVEKKESKESFSEVKKKKKKKKE